MIVVLKKNATEADLHTLSEEIEKRGYQVHLSRGVERTLVGCIGAPEKIRTCWRTSSLPSPSWRTWSGS